MHDSSVKFLTRIIGFEALIAGSLILTSPSMARNAQALGLSQPRLIAGSGLLVFGLVLMGATIDIGRLSTLRKFFLPRIESVLSEADHLAWLISILVAALVFSIATLSLFLHPITAAEAYTVHIATLRMIPLGIWLCLIPVQLLAFTTDVLRRNPDLHKSLPKRFPNIAFLSTLLAATGFYFVLLIFQIPLLDLISGWFWEFIPKRIRWSHIGLIPYLAVIIGSAYWLREKSDKRIVAMLVLTVIASLSQFFPGIISGRGISEIRQNYVETPLSSELQLACLAPPMGHAIQEYERLFADDFWYGTKPPGLLSSYILFGKFVGYFDPYFSEENCFIRLVDYMTWALPIVSSLIVFGVWLLSRDLLSTGATSAAPIFVATAPNFVLMGMIPDQIIYLPLFLATILILHFGIRSDSRLLLFAAGAFCYLAVFVSFSLLPVLLLASLWTLVSVLKDSPRKRIMRKLADRFLPLGIGFLSLTVFALYTFSYNPLQRFANAMWHHRELKEMVPGISAYFEYTLLNVLEFSIWIGIPLALLGTLRLVRSVRLAMSGNLERESVPFLSLAVVFAGLIILGQTRGEVGRIWLFLLPLFGMAAAEEVQEIMPSPSTVLALVLVLQVLSTYLTFVFQDFA